MNRTKKINLIISLGIFFVLVFAGPIHAYKVIDLTQKFENGMPAWAGKWEGMSMWGGAKSQDECYKIVGWYGYDLKFTEHTGTHMDSPAHQPS
ncbi:MAG: cyclase family protein, partial [Deltaproteobacteria bacterium]